MQSVHRCPYKNLLMRTTINPRKAIGDADGAHRIRDAETSADEGTECNRGNQKRCKKVMFQSARDSENFLESMKTYKASNRGIW